MKKAKFYIGQNNETKELENDKIEKSLVKHFEGFTALEVIGYWQGSKEKTLLVETITEKSDSELAKITKELCELLDQDTIILEIVETNTAFISK